MLTGVTVQMERQAVAKVEKIPTSNNRPHRKSVRSSSARNSFLELQRSIGNQAIQRLADRVVDSGMRRPEPDVSRQAVVQLKSKSPLPLAVREDDEEEKSLVQRACAGGS